jgi:hypothetical protein
MNATMLLTNILRAKFIESPHTPPGAIAACEGTDV